MGKIPAFLLATASGVFGGFLTVLLGSMVVGILVEILKADAGFLIASIACGLGIGILVYRQLTE